MLIIVKNNYEFFYDIESITQIFTLRDEIKYLNIEDIMNGKLINVLRTQKQSKNLICILKSDSNKAWAYAYYTENMDDFLNIFDSVSTIDDFREKKGYYEDTSIEGLDFDKIKKISKHILRRTIYRAIKAVIDKNVPWGILTGIRPTKRVYSMFKEGLTQQQVLDILKKDFFVSNEKAGIICKIAEIQKKMLEGINPKSVSLYVHIPFCPTRCVYCSFASLPILEHKNIVDAYVDSLIKEIKFVGDWCYENNILVTSIYVGGGTPTSLDNNRLNRILEQLKTSIDFRSIKEFTVEAGRPDTIDRQKLETLFMYGVDRISINPQTMNDITLKVIGRNHTSKDIEEKYKLAREIGFKTINMDIIAGLPGENISMLNNTIEKITAMKPDNLTVHNMAIKRASRLNYEFDDYEIKKENEIQEMINAAGKAAFDMKMKPYYLYRQKHMIGNMENTGYAIEGHECYYNIVMMEEKQNIIGVGAGAISKFIDFKTYKLERVFNVKGVYDYISRIDEMLQRKKDKFNIIQSNI